MSKIRLSAVICIGSKIEQQAKSIQYTKVNVTLQIADVLCNYMKEMQPQIYELYMRYTTAQNCNTDV